MVETQLRERGVFDTRVLEAFGRIPRHEFVPPALTEESYADRPLAIGDAETISQPYIVAAMTQAVRPQAGEKALEVGTGSGYQAAILAALGLRVITVERNAALYQSARRRLSRLGFDSVEPVYGDGSVGYPAEAPYDVILITAAAPRVPQVLLEQLAEGGRMVLPVGTLSQQDLKLIVKNRNGTGTRAGDGLVSRTLDPCKFIPLVGKYGWPEKHRETRSPFFGARSEF